MDWAQLVLEYLRVLIWPLVILVLVLVFRREVGDKISTLKSASTPVGDASFFDSDAKAVEERAGLVAELQSEADTSLQGDESDRTVAEAGLEAVKDDPDKPESELQRVIEAELDKRERFVAVSTALARLNELPDFDIARGIASDSPRASVMLGYTDFEAIVRAAWTLLYLQPPGRQSVTKLIDDLHSSGGLDADFASVARELAELRNRITHAEPSGHEVSTSGAIDFIQACDQLGEALASVAISKFRHPSQSRVVNELIEWAQQHGLVEDPDA